MAPHIYREIEADGDGSAIRIRANTLNKTKVGKVTRKQVMDIVKVSRKI